MYSEPSQKSKMERFAKIINDWKPLIIFTKSSILDENPTSREKGQEIPILNTKANTSLQKKNEVFH